MKRVKYVRKTSMVVHLWANQSQDRANSRGNRIYFDGDTIYSYGRHFPIAVHYLRPNSLYGDVILFTTASYSNTTARHKCRVRSACGHKTVFTVPSIQNPPDHDANWRSYEERYAAIFEKAEKSRLYVGSLLDDAKRLLTEANKYAEHFGLKQRLVFTDQNKWRALEQKSNERKVIHDATVEKKRAERNAQWLKTVRLDALSVQERLTEWLNGGTYHGLHYGPVYLRAHNGMCETTKGAECPLDHAKLAYRQVIRCVQNKTGWRKNGETIQVGTFQIDSIDENGNVVAGCHNIHYSEIIRFAATQGW